MREGEEKRKGGRKEKKSYADLETSGTRWGG